MAIESLGLNRTTAEIPLGYRTAKRVIEIGRQAFFGTMDYDLPRDRSSHLKQDDMTPQFGYVGTQYSKSRVLLLGINPGNGPIDNLRTSGDERMMPVLRSFAERPSPETFIAATLAYKTECQLWSVWKKHCAEVIGAGELSLEEIAYSNCLPWRTQSKSNFDDTVASKAAKLYAIPLVEELNPFIIIAMGKRAATILTMSGHKLPVLITWNRAQAARLRVIEERLRTAAEVLRLIGRFE